MKDRISTLFIIMIFLVSCVQKEAVSTQGSVKEEKSCQVSAAALALSNPQSIQELITFINALPKPMDLSCFLQSLKRPLFINATASTLSAQPAGSPNSPRIFIIKGDLLISVVPDGEGSEIMEFSELTNSVRTVKGEISLPVETDLGQSDPFVRINNGSRTSCSGCHGSEQFEKLVDGVATYSSVAFKPKPSKDVSLQTLNELNLMCQSLNEKSKRCANLKALLSAGEVNHTPFPEDFAIFLQFGN